MQRLCNIVKTTIQQNASNCIITKNRFATKVRQKCQKMQFLFIYWTKIVFRYTALGGVQLAR